ncbi:MAG: type I-U CRISPR-associated protein Cas5/Cas6 [Planctomycetaceae bacterium]|nr:type I-U CRISPR-associated protein Cas5/Cas6 [Planctomycetaceae bacterium]
MPDYLRFTIRFLQPLVHGRCDGGGPEWPPSPLRFFQALVAAAAAKSNERQRIESAAPALRWLQELPSPQIVACKGVASEVPTQFYVPDNSANLLVPSWKRGETDNGPKRTDKVVLPTHISGEAAHNLFPLPSVREIAPELSSEWRRFARCRRDGKLAPPQDVGFALKLHFAEPVSGPLALGYASHFGLGWLAAES